MNPSLLYVAYTCCVQHPSSSPENVRIQFLPRQSPGLRLLKNEIDKSSLNKVDLSYPNLKRYYSSKRCRTARVAAIDFVVAYGLVFLWG